LSGYDYRLTRSSLGLLWETGKGLAALAPFSAVESG
jgi:hypothetical protein